MQENNVLAYAQSKPNKTVVGAGMSSGQGQT